MIKTSTNVTVYTVAEFITRVLTSPGVYTGTRVHETALTESVQKTRLCEVEALKKETR